MDDVINEKQEEIVLATIASVGQSGVTIIVDGNEEPGEKEYKVNANQRFVVGDRVKIHKNSGTYLIEYAIGNPMSRYPIPPGGTDGQVLMKDGSNDYTVKWAASNGIPKGGSSGQVLAKNTSSDYAVTWTTPHYVPSGGSKDQVLAKLTAVSYELHWVTLKGLPSGGTTGQVLKKSSNSDYAVYWATA